MNRVVKSLTYIVITVVMAMAIFTGKIPGQVVAPSPGEALTDDQEHCICEAIMCMKAWLNSAPLYTQETKDELIGYLDRLKVTMKAGKVRCILTPFGPPPPPFPFPNPNPLPPPFCFEHDDGEYKGYTSPDYEIVCPNGVIAKVFVKGFNFGQYTLFGCDLLTDWHGEKKYFLAFAAVHEGFRLDQELTQKCKYPNDPTERVRQRCAEEENNKHQSSLDLIAACVALDAAHGDPVLVADPVEKKATIARLTEAKDRALQEFGFACIAINVLGCINLPPLGG